MNGIEPSTEPIKLILRLNTDNPFAKDLAVKICREHFGGKGAPAFVLLCKGEKSKRAVIEKLSENGGNPELLQERLNRDYRLVG